MDTALIFANGELSDGPLVRAVLEPRPRWVIAADGGARAARFLGILPDVVIGDMDSLTPQEVDELAHHNVDIIRHPAEKNETDLELALLWAVERMVGRIRVIGALGKRLDQTMGNIQLLALPHLVGCDVRLIADRQQAWLLVPGTHAIEGHEGDTVSLLPLSGAARGIRTDKLYYPLRNETLRFGPARGISNVMTADQAQVSFDEGILLVVHTIGRA